MHARVLLCNYQHTKFEVPSFTDSKDMIEAKFKNGSRDFNHAHYGVVCHPEHLVLYLHTEFGDSRFRSFGAMIAGVKN